MYVHVLGGVHLHDEQGREIPLDRSDLRGIVTVLALADGPVPGGVGIDDLRETVPGLVAPAGDGYRLAVPAADIDEFRALIAQAAAARADRPARAAELLREAVGLWGSAPLADLPRTPDAQSGASRLREAYREAVEALARTVPDVPAERVRVDTGVASPARVYDFLLGGKDNFPADREAAALAMTGNPHLPTVARENRGFLVRAVRHIAEQGVTQFVDLGSGLPTADNVHQVAQRTNPASRVVYVDNDPIVRAHANALLVGDPQTEFVEADAREPEAVRAAAGLLEPARPLALLAFTLFHFLTDEQVRHVLAVLLGPAPAGSYLALSHVTPDGSDPAALDHLLEAARRSDVAVFPRTADRLAALVAGLEILSPGIVAPARWRSEGGEAPPGLKAWGLVARKP